MPLLKLETTVALSEDKKKALLASLSKAVAGTIGKPEQYVMVGISESAIWMSGNAGDAAFVDIRSIGGLAPDVNRKFSEQVGKLLADSLQIPPERVYLNFTDVKAANWVGIEAPSGEPSCAQPRAGAVSSRGFASGSLVGSAS